MSGGSSVCNSSDLTSSLESPNSDFKFIKPTPQQIIVQQQQQQASALKMSKSPTMLRQLSLGKGLANINPNIITSLQFSSSNSPQSKTLITNIKVIPIIDVILRYRRCQFGFNSDVMSDSNFVYNGSNSGVTKSTITAIICQLDPTALFEPFQR